MFSFVKQPNLIIFGLLYYIATFSFFFFKFFSYIPYPCSSIESIDYILLSLLALNAILLTSSVNTLCFSHLHLFFFFFVSGYSLQTLTIHRTTGEGRGPSFIPLYHFYPLTNVETFICNFACEMTITYF